MRKIVCVLCALALLGASSVLAVEPIGSLFKDKISSNTPVKIYLKEIVNQSGQGQVLPDVFKKALEKSLQQRRSIKFAIVADASASDIQVSVTVKNFQYMDRGPLKPSPAIQATLLDAAATASMNYVEMAVDYTVTDTKTGKVLWQNTVNEYLKKKMTPEESIPLIYDVVTRTFVWRCFGKANLRESKNRVM